jgi:hypothetical protein
MTASKLEYTAEFKKEAVCMIISSQKSCTASARNLGCLGSVCCRSALMIFSSGLSASSTAAWACSQVIRGDDQTWLPGILLVLDHRITLADRTCSDPR